MKLGKISLLVGALLVMNVSLTSCHGLKKDLKTDNRMEWGQVGVAPTGVWTNYNWIIVDTNKYMVVER